MKRLLGYIIANFVIGFSLNAQNVGIGTSNPQERLDVTGAVKISHTATANEGTIRFDTINKIFQGYDGTQWINLGSVGGGTDDQTLSFNNDSLSIEDGNGISLASYKKHWYLSGGNIYSDSSRVGIGFASLPISANLLIAGNSASEGGEIQLNGGSSYTSSGYAIDNFEGRLRFMKIQNSTGSASLATTSELLSIKSSGQIGLGTIGGNAWPSESNVIIGPVDSGDEGGQLQFYNAQGAGTSWFLDVWQNDFRFLTGNNITGSSGNAMQLNNSGDLAVSGSVRAKNGRFYGEVGCDNYLHLQADGNVVIYNSGGSYMGWATGTSCSDIRLKENVTNLESVLPFLNELSIIRYTYKKETGLTQDPQIGVIAQELAAKYPEMVYYNAAIDQYLVYYDKLSALVIKGIQEQQQELELLKQQYRELNEKIELLLKN